MTVNVYRDILLIPVSPKAEDLPSIGTEKVYGDYLRGDKLSPKLIRILRRCRMKQADYRYRE